MEGRFASDRFSYGRYCHLYTILTKRMYSDISDILTWESFLLKRNSDLDVIHNIRGNLTWEVMSRDSLW
jgi:hypothetical protein